MTLLLSLVVEVVSETNGSSEGALGLTSERSRRGSLQTR